MLGCCNLVLAQLELTLQNFDTGQSRQQNPYDLSSQSVDQQANTQPRQEATAVMPVLQIV